MTIMRKHPRPTRALSFLAALALLALGTALGVAPSYAADETGTASDTDTDFARMILVLIARMDPFRVLRAARKLVAMLLDEFRVLLRAVAVRR